MLHIDLSELAGGELQAKFDREITRVIQNMQDPNTPFGDSRGVTISIVLKQNEMRDDAKIEISVKSKLAGVISAKTNFAMGKDLGTGDVLVSEYGKQISGQLSFSDAPQENEDDQAGKVMRLPRSLRAN